METLMFAFPAVGLGMIAAGVALGVKPARPSSPGPRRLIKRCDTDRPQEPKSRRWTFSKRPASPSSMPAAKPDTPWFRRLDPTLQEADVRARCDLAESLGTVRASWAAALLGDAFAAEPDARVRARILAALFRGLHFEDERIFVTAAARGGIERAVVLERLALLANIPEWAVGLANTTVDDDGIGTEQEGFGGAPDDQESMLDRTT